MPDICLCLQVHQPYRLRRFHVLDIGTGSSYFDDERNRDVLCGVAERCYIPANELLSQLIHLSDGHFRVAVSLSGTVLEQLETYAPEALASFQALVATRGVELLGETYYHSLASVADPVEFMAQVEMHTAAIRRLFGVRPRFFRNTELLYSDAIAPIVARLGFRGVLVEGVSRVLGNRSPNHVYESAGAPGLRLLPRHYGLSDDIALRFSNPTWSAGPLTADTFAQWLAESGGACVNLLMNYETFGEHQRAEAGIFEFLKRLPRECERRGLRFTTPSELARLEPRAPLRVPTLTSWADAGRDASTWLGRRLHRAAHHRLYELRKRVEQSDDALLEHWRRLTTSDHMYHMSTKWHTDGDVHAYFNPFGTPYDAFISFMNVLQDLQHRTAASDVGSADTHVLPFPHGMAVAS